MLTRYEVQEDMIIEEHEISDQEMAEFTERLGRVHKRPSKAAERRSAVWQIQADLDDLADLYESGEG